MPVGTFLARGISIILQPLLVPTYAVLLLFVYTNFGIMFRGQQLRIVLPVFIFTFVIPSIFIAILKQLQVVEDYGLNKKEDRFWPYFIAFLANVSLFYFFYTANLQLWFLAFIAVSIVLAVVSFIINIFWKISAHMVAFGGLIGGVLSISYNIYRTNPFILFAVLFILAGCLGMARLVLKRHTPAQVYVGFALGLVLAYVCIWLGPFLIKMSIQ